MHDAPINTIVTIATAIATLAGLTGTCQTPGCAGIAAYDRSSPTVQVTTSQKAVQTTDKGRYQEY